MNKALEALKRIENKTITITYGKNVAHYRYGDYLLKEDLDLIEKSIKALEILKPYIRVYKDILPNGTIYYFLNGLLTDKETYERVKEWLEK